MFLAVVLIFFFLVEADGEGRASREFSAGSRDCKQQRLSQSCVWILVQDTGAVGLADGGDECA